MVVEAPNLPAPDRSQWSSVWDRSGGLEDSWSCLPYWVEVTLMSSKYHQSYIMMIKGNDTGTGVFFAFVCLLVFIYTQQFADVRWVNSEISSIITMKKRQSCQPSLSSTT